ncbi:uncharacterized protein [Ptychodera flava]|uniref:uncharacterized protein isoform X2 n=1 Tax=Ptychodera flava TaxID=63121 RepID=UPI003969CB37
MADVKGGKASPENKQKEHKEVTFSKKDDRENSRDGQEEGTKSRPSTRQSQKSSASLTTSEMSYNTLRKKFLESGDTPKQSSPTTTEMMIRKRKKKKGKRSKTPNSFDDDEEREAKRLQELQEKHMQILEDLTKLRNHYYFEYMSALNEKVEKQRKDIQKKTDELQQKIEEKKEKAKAATHHVKMTKERSNLSHDNSFLRDLPKTQFYNIVAVQDKMYKEGKLKTQTEVDSFWEEIQIPEKYNEMFGIAPTNTIESGSNLESPSTVSAASNHSFASIKVPVPDGFVPMGQITEDKEPSRPSTKGTSMHQWAVTQRFTKVQHGPSSYLSAPVKGRRTSIHPKALAVDQRFPKVELPRMAAFTLDLAPKKEDPELIKMNEEIKLRARIRDFERRRLRTMYEYALAHQAATHRILDKKEDFAWMTQGPSIGDFIGVSDQDPRHKYPVLPSPPGVAEPPEISLPPLEEDKPLGYLALPSTMDSGNKSGPLSAIDELSEHRSIYSSVSSKKSMISSKTGSKYSRGSRRVKSADQSEEVEYQIAPSPPSKPLPLTMKSILDDCVIKEAKCLSTLWVNPTLSTADVQT